MRWFILCVLCLVWASFAQAQTGATLDACLADATVQMPDGGLITVDATAGGVTVLAVNSKRCQASIKNTGAAAMSCGPSTEVVTATVGWPLSAGETLVLRAEGRAEWKCIRTTGTSTTAAVMEAISR